MINSPLVLLLLSFSVLFSVSTHAAPTLRANCLCSTVQAQQIPSPPISEDLQHQQSLSLSRNHNILQEDSQILNDPCASLGPQLEHLRHAAPEVYAQYFPAEKGLVPTPSLRSEEKPIATSVLLALAARNEYSASDILQNPSVSPPLSTKQTIICRSPPSPATELRFSKVTLWGLQCLVAMAVLGCISECISVVGQW
jgi:hypothetical protein